MNSIVEYIDTIKTLIQADESIIDPLKINELFLNALDIFSREHPKIIITDIIGDGTSEHDVILTKNGTWVTVTDYTSAYIVEPTVANGYYYRCTVAGKSGIPQPTWPTVIGNTVVDGTVTWTCYATTKLTSWVNEFSQILSVEYPADETPPAYLTYGADQDYYVYRLETAKYKLRFTSASPTASEKIRVAYTTPWEGTNISVSSIPIHQQRAVCHLTASLAFNLLGAFYAQTSKASVGMDIIDFGNKSGFYYGLAKSAKDIYNQIMGSAGGIKPASATKEWIMTDSLGQAFLCH